MNSLVRKLIAVLLVIILVGANLTILGEYTIAYAASDDELNKQDSKTNNKNVSFNSYFDGESHSAVFDINSEEAKIYLKLGVNTAGYVENGTIEFQNVNFKIKDGIENENIQSIDTQNNKVVLDRVNNGSEIVVELPIEILNEDNVSIDHFNKEFVTKFTGTYIDEDGNEKAIEKEITNKLSWNGTAEAEVTTEGTKYIPYATKGNYGVMIQTKVNVSVKDNTLPIKNTNIEVTAPEVNLVKPTSVTVVATSMAATNGEAEGLDFTSDNYAYDAETGKVTINVDNLADSISWKKNVSDEYLLTYLYEGKDIYDYAKANAINTTSDVTAKLTLYNNVEIVAEKSATAEIKFDKQEGTIADFSMEVPSNISKGYLYANYDADKKVETEYNENYIATVNSASLVTSIEFVQGADSFVTEDKAEGSTTVSGTNYAYDKQIEVRQDIFNKMLGEDGSITVKDNKDKQIGVINKDTELKDGKYILDISKQNTNQVTITTSAPITEGQLEVNIVKALKGNIDYSIDQMKEFKTLKARYEGNTDTTTYNVEKEISLKEPETKIDLEVNKTELTTVVTNENVELRAVLDTSSVYNALYKNPTLKITLPSDVKKINLKGTKLLLDKGLKVKSSKVSEENGHIAINVVLEGTQTEYTIDAEYKGAIVVLNTDLTLDTLAASGTEKITMSYTNGNDAATKTKGTVEKAINIVAPTGVVASTGIKNYKDGENDVQSVSGEAKTVDIDANSANRVATIDGAVVNNYQNDISNIVVLGRIPAQGNKEIDSDQDLGSTFTIPLATGVGTTGLKASDYTVYYSDNANATKDLNDANNGWKQEATTASKSYLMVFNDDYKMKSGDKFEFTYDIDMPADISNNNSAYAMYKVYFNNDAEIGTISENKTSAILGVTTGTGPEAEITLKANTDTVREGQIVEMTATIKNVGDEAIENAKLKVVAPDGTIHTGIPDGLLFYEDSDEKEKIIDNIGNIGVGETKEVNYELRIEKGVKETVDTNENGEQVVIEEEVYPGDKDVENTVSLLGDNIEGEIKSEPYTFKVLEGDVTATIVTDTSGKTLRKGQVLNYKVTLENISYDKDLSNVTLHVNLPEGLIIKDVYYSDSLSFVDNSKDGVNINGNDISVNVGELKSLTAFLKNNNQAQTINLRTKCYVYIEFEVDTFTGDLNTMMTVTADGIDEHYSNVNKLRAEVIDLSLVQEEPEKQYIKEGTEYTYRFTITNNGAVRSIQNVFSMKIPDGLSFVKATYTADGSEKTLDTITNKQLELEAVNIDPNQKIVIDVTVKADLLSSSDDKEITTIANLEAVGMDRISSNEVTVVIEYDPNANHSGNGGSGGGATGYKITGRAWLDSNQNGSRDDNENGIANIPVLLLDKATNNVVTDSYTNEPLQVTTSTDGKYEFDNLPNGEYLVVFVYDSSNFSLTEYQKDGVNERFNSDAIDVNLTLNGERRIAGITDTLTIDGDNVRDIDIGLYTANKFDLRLDKYIEKISLTTPTIGTRVDQYNNSELAKVEVLGQNLGKSSAVVEYKIVVTNEGSVPGYVNKIVDYLPNDVDFSTELNTDWYLSDNGNIYNSSLADQKINPGESKEVTLIVSVKITEDLLGTITNNAEIYESYNDLGLQDIDSTIANKIETEDDMGKADVIFSLVTGKIVMYTSIAFVVIALIGFGAYEIKKRVLNKKD